MMRLKKIVKLLYWLFSSVAFLMLVKRQYEMEKITQETDIK